MRLYEGISKFMNDQINNKLKKLESESFQKVTTHRERQYIFLTFLQGIGLEEKQIFDIYTNTKLK